MRFAAAAAAAAFAAAPLPHPGVPLSDSHCTAAIISAFLAPQRTSARTTLSSGPEKLASLLVPTLYTIPEVPKAAGPALIPLRREGAGIIVCIMAEQVQLLSLQDRITELEREVFHPELKSGMCV